MPLQLKPLVPVYSSLYIQRTAKFTGELGHPKSPKILCREIYLVHTNMLALCCNANLPYCRPNPRAWHTNKQGGGLILSICITDCFPHCEPAWLQLCRHHRERDPANAKLPNPLGGLKCELQFSHSPWALESVVQRMAIAIFPFHVCHAEIIKIYTSIWGEPQGFQMGNRSAYFILDYHLHQKALPVAFPPVEIIDGAVIERPRGPSDRGLCSS